MRTVVDVVILVILFFFLLNGIRRGLIRQVLHVVGIIVAFIGAFYLAHYLAHYIHGRFYVDHRVSLVISAVVLFVGIIVLFHFIGLALQKVARITLLGPLDRIGGAVFGLLKGALLVSLLLVIALSIPLPSTVKNELVRDPLVAAMYPVLPVLFNLVVSHSPAGLYFENSIDRIGDSETLIKAKRTIEDMKTRLKKDGT